MKLEFPLFPKQRLLLTSKGTEVLWGGAAGPGKSHGARIALIAWCLAVPGLQCYLFRRKYKDLRPHMDGPTGFRALLEPLVKAGRVIIRQSDIEFVQEKSRIYLAHCQYEKDVYSYQSAEFHVLILEEATQFTEFQIRFLRSRVRMPIVMQERIPPELKGCFPRILYPTNPGGIGHQYLKNNFVTESKKHRKGNEDLQDVIWRAPDDEGGFLRQFIPAKLRDNPAVNPDQYEKTLSGLPVQLRRALLDGDWDAVVGAFFPEARYDRHVIRPPEIPEWAFKFRTFDWGSDAPAAVQWWAVAEGRMQAVTIEGNLITIPRGSLVCYREWYIAQSTDDDKGLGLTNVQMARGIKERTDPREIIQCTIADGKPFQATGGKTIAQEFADEGVILTMGDVSPGSRHQGGAMIRSRLVGDNGPPLIYFSTVCPKSWEHLVQIQVSPRKWDEWDTEGTDHTLDAVALACKARPYVREQNLPNIDTYTIPPENITYDQVIKKIQRRKHVEHY